MQSPFCNKELTILFYQAIILNNMMQQINKYLKTMITISELMTLYNVPLASTAVGDCCGEWRIARERFTILRVMAVAARPK
jgi:hypothetical protein